MTRRLPAVLAAVSLAALTGCVALPFTPPQPPEPTPEREFAARDLATLLITPEEYGEAWTLRPGEEGTGGGPVRESQTQYDPCTWATSWIPDHEPFSTQAWRFYEGADGTSWVSDWILAAAPGVDLRDTLDAFAAGIEACGGSGVAFDSGAALTFETGIGPELGDASFSYRATFADDLGSYAEGEVHTVICGPLWIHLSYSGLDPFVERDELLPLLVERAAEVGGCAP